MDYTSRPPSRKTDIDIAALVAKLAPPTATWIATIVAAVHEAHVKTWTPDPLGDGELPNQAQVAKYAKTSVDTVQRKCAAAIVFRVGRSPRYDLTHALKLLGEKTPKTPSNVVALSRKAASR